MTIVRKITPLIDFLMFLKSILNFTNLSGIIMGIIKFNKPYQLDLQSDIFNHQSGDGPYTKLVLDVFQETCSINSMLLTTSCTHALEMAAILLNIKPGDEIISPSFTFVSTVNAFVLRGAKIIFVDIDPLTMNIDANLIEAALTLNTKAIVVVHYAGVACDMDRIMDIASRHKLIVVEDAAQAVMAKYKVNYLGTIGSLGTYSFHETKNYSMGEGGALVINSIEYKERAEIIREKGTNRSIFLRGQVDKYTWVDLGSSYLPSDILAAHLYHQLLISDVIFDKRMFSWELYYNELSSIKNYIDLPHIPNYAKHNAHMFYIKAKDIEERTKLIEFLKNRGIQAVFHYVPLHSSPAGLKYGRFHGEDNYTSKESERLVRLPLYYNIDAADIMTVCKSIKDFYNDSSIKV